MKHLGSLLKNELRMLFVAPATYVAAVLFLAMMGLFFVFILDQFVQHPQTVLPTTQFFKIFWIPVFFVVPLLTMRSFAEERRLGTLETLLTAPVSTFEVVLSKFIGAYFFYLLLWALSLGFPMIALWSLPRSAIDPRLLETASLFGGYTFIALTGIPYIAIGIFTSCLTRSQLVAAMLCFSFLFVFIIGGRFLNEVSWLHTFYSAVDYLQTFDHLDDFSRGIMDSRPFFFYSSVGGVLLGLTNLLAGVR
ncbi:MAG: hypothetical protein A2Y14_02000 [Verrucomicrobia bacterium GWF2_51_19]|nr:MAG: hypothetical protein A2Y14_02000 [Verrucomicrobia bacterium GWF2_51_19]HCJ11758.1 hypothetical protein [Opitutae bacterium]